MPSSTSKAWRRRNRIARLMRLHGLRGVSRRRGGCVTTKRNKERQTAADLVQRRFVANAINPLCLAGMTPIPTWAGSGCSAVVPDVFSRKAVGSAFGQRQTADLVIAALPMARSERQSNAGSPGMVHHADQGSQYASMYFGSHRGRSATLTGVSTGRPACGGRDVLVADTIGGGRTRRLLTPLRAGSAAASA
jgi:transposase InsO family protein